MCRRVQSGSGGLNLARLVAVGLIRVRVGSLWREGTTGSCRFAWVHSGAHMGLRVHSGTRGFSLVVSGFIRVCVRSIGYS